MHLRPAPEARVCDPQRVEHGLELRNVVRRWAGLHEPGRHSIPWDLRDARGRAVSPGIYAYRLRASAFEAQRKMVVIP